MQVRLAHLFCSNTFAASCSPIGVASVEGELLLINANANTKPTPPILLLNYKLITEGIEMLLFIWNDKYEWSFQTK